MIGRMLGIQVELIDPALKGTVNVLRSCAKVPSIKRVVLTSSMVAVICNRKMLTPGLHIDETWFSDPLFCKESKGIDFVRIGRNDAVHEEVRGHCFSAMDIHSIEDIKVRLDQIKVVAVTCLGITSPLLVNKRFDVCIMDEAGQTTLPVSLGPLMYASKFVLVGDHYQLPPLVQSTESLENGIGVSLFCRLSEAHPQAILALQNQYRMCASIMDLSNALIYGNRLRCGSCEVEKAKLKYTSSKYISSWLNEVSFGSLIGFLPYCNLPTRWKFLAFESWLRGKALDLSKYKQNFFWLS